MTENGFYHDDLSLFQVPVHYGDHALGFRERKKARTEFYFKYVHGNKLKQCPSCSGGRYYCGHACSWCKGTGKVRER